MAKIIADGIVIPVGKSVESPTYDEVAERAYFIYEARGGDHGRDMDDWLQAESELLTERALAVDQES